jgi:hypothetical protein
LAALRLMTSSTLVGCTTGRLAGFSRIAANCEDYGNRQGRRFRCARGGKPAHRSDDRHLTPNEIGRQCWQPIDLIAGPAVFVFKFLRSV